jgi:nitroimidazol reductase NimA-like FMN-containing flavoprotein (pyridoxamine 5'-phosphate oxidase superfamily)
MLEPESSTNPTRDTSGPTTRSKLKRLPERGHYDLETVHRLIDEIGVGTIGYATDGQPRLTPTFMWRAGNSIYWHGSSVSTTIKDLADGIDCCANMYVLDGFAFGRSGFHTSVNYRSVTIYGTARPVAGEEAKLAALEEFMEHFMPGRWEDLRPPHQKEMRASTILSMEIEDAAAKIRTGMPNDDAEDYELPIWAGIVPISKSAGEPEDDPKLLPGVNRPGYLRDTWTG